MHPLDPVYCLKCRQVLESTDVFCKHCGHNQTQLPHPSTIVVQPQVQQVVHPQVQPLVVLPSPSQTCCPTCSGDSIQKVSAIHRGGVWTANTSGGFAGAVHTGGGHYSQFGGVTSSSTSGATALAQSLSPPVMPVRGVSPAAAGAIILGAAAVFCGFAAQNGGDSSMVPLEIIASVLSAILIPIAVVQSKGIMQEYEGQLSAWKRWMVTWDRLYYCSRCDRVFDPVNGTSEAPGRIHILL